MKSKYLVLIAIGGALLLYSAQLASGGNKVISANKNYAVFFEYNLPQKIKMSTSFWVDPEVARQSQIAIFSSPKTVSEYSAALDVLKAGGLVAVKQDTWDAFKVFKVDTAITDMNLKFDSVDGLIKSVKSLPENSTFGVLIAANEWTSKSLVAKKIIDVSTKRKKLVAWGEIDFLKKQVIEEQPNPNPDLNVLEGKVGNPFGVPGFDAPDVILRENEK